MPCHLPQAFIYDIQILATMLMNICGLLKGNWLYSTVLTTLNSTLIQRSQVSDLASIFLKEIESTYNIQKLGDLRELWISGFSYKTASFHSASNMCW